MIQILQRIEGRLSEEKVVKYVYTNILQPEFYDTYFKFHILNLAKSKLGYPNHKEVFKIFTVFDFSISSQRSGSTTCLGVCLDTGSQTTVIEFNQVDVYRHDMSL